jgi:HEAT repeat protein
MRAARIAFFLSACLLLLCAGARVLPGGEPAPDRDAEIQGWIERLRHFDTQEGATAFENLLKAGDAAIPRLVEAMNDRFNKDLRSLSASILAKMGPSGRKALIECLKHESARVRQNAALQLGVEKVAEAADPMTECLRDPDPEVRATAACFIGQLGSAKAVEPLLAALSDAWPDVRSGAAESLGRLKDPRAVDKGDTDTAQTAAKSLGRLGDRRAAPALVRMFKRGNGSEKPVAAEALGRIGDASALEHVRSAWRGDDHPSLRVWYAFATVRIGGDKDARRFVIDCIRGTEDRYAALEALQGIAGPEDIPALASILAAGDDDSTEELAVEALGRIGTKDVVDPLIGALRTGEWNVRVHAARFLRKTTGQEFAENYRDWKAWREKNR